MLRLKTKLQQEDFTFSAVLAEVKSKIVISGMKQCLVHVHILQSLSFVSLQYFLKT